jgi:FixJ family two-component response regulator
MLQVCGVSTPIIVVSGHLDDESVCQLKERGPRHFLEKPFTVPGLLAAVGNAVCGGGCPD